MMTSRRSPFSVPQARTPPLLRTLHTTHVVENYSDKNLRIITPTDGCAGADDYNGTKLAILRACLRRNDTGMKMSRQRRNDDGAMMRRRQHHGAADDDHR